MQTKTRFKKHKWTEKELEFIINNYSSLGTTKCSNTLKLTIPQTYSMSKKLELKFKRKCKIDFSKIYPITKPEASYILGLLWADGHVCKRENNYRVEIELLSKDTNNLINIFETTGKWGKYEDNRSNNKRIKLYCDNKELHSFLSEYDYKNKSNESADKILSIMPNHLQHYFFRGVIDGDGCWFISPKNSKNRNKNFMLTGSYEQNWNYFENLLSKLSVKYSVKRKKHIKGNYSRIEVCKKEDIVKLGDNIYKDYCVDKIGLERKHLKFLEIKNYKSYSSLGSKGK